MNEPPTTPVSRLSTLLSKHNVTTYSEDRSEDLTGELADILDGYLQALESGQAVSPQQILEQYPQHANVLREYLEGLRLLHCPALAHDGIAAGGLGGEYSASATAGSLLTPRSDSTLHSGNGTVESDDAGGERTLGDFRILRQVGRGGMGVVYEARQISLNRRVALKVLPAAFGLDPRQMIRFENEARSAAQLHHPHVVPIYGVGADQGIHYYAMQFIDGPTLRDVIDRRAAGKAGSGGGQQDRAWHRRVATWGIQACEALHAAHSCGVIHRDIKPSNLMLDPNGRLWVTDFGLARCQQSQQNLTQTGDVVGTLHYMSPEQAQGQSAVADPRSDTYSLAVTLYELLTLQRPFAGTGHAEVLRRIELGNYRPARQCNKHIPRDLENVLAKAMATEPGERYGTATDLAADLTRFLEGQPTLAKPPTAWQRSGKWVARNRPAVVSAMIALMVICVSLAGVNLWLIGRSHTLQRDTLKAKLSFEDAEHTLKQFGLRLADTLRHVEGMESDRQELLESMLAHYQDLLARFSDSPTLRADMAITHTKMASVYHELGDAEAALSAYEHAISAFDSLASTEPGRAEFQRQLAECHSSHAMLLWEQGQQQQALDESAVALDQLRKLHATHSAAETDSPPADLTVALVHALCNRGVMQANRQAAEELYAESEQTLQDALGEVLGDVLSSRPLRRPTRDSLRRRLESAEATAGDETDVPQLLAAAATTYRAWSKLYERVGEGDQSPDWDLAIRHLVKAIGCTQRLHRAQPSETHELTLAQQYHDLGDLLVRADRGQRGIDAYRRAAYQLRHLQRPQLRVATLCALAKAQKSQGDTAAAQQSYQQAITEQSAVLVKYPGDLTHVSRLGSLYNNLAYLQQKTHQYKHAEYTYGMALDYQSRAYQLASHVPAYRDALSRTLFNTSSVYMTLGRPAAAARLQLRRAQLWPDDPQQLFSAAGKIAAAIEVMPPTAPIARRWRRVASDLLVRARAADGKQTLPAAETQQLLAQLDIGRWSQSKLDGETASNDVH